MDINSIVRSNIAPAAVAGVVGGIAAKVFFGASGSVPVWGMMVNAPLTVGVANAGGYIGGEILAELTKGSFLDSPMLDESRVLPVVGSGIATYGILRLVAGEGVSLTRAGTLGAASALAGKYISDMYYQ